MDLDKLRVFHMVAKEESIYKASERLRIASSAVSRTIQLLEESLENKLFIRRQSKGVELTPVGQFLLEKTEEILAIAHEAEFAAKDMDKEPKGLLKIISTPGVMKNFIIKFIPSFIKKHPKIELVLHTTTDASLVSNNVDVAIGPYHNSSDEIIQVKLYSTRYHIYASQKYLDTYGTPKRPEDLDNHKLIIYSIEEFPYLKGLDWLLAYGAHVKKHRKPYIQVNNTDAMFELVKEGIGIGTFVPEFIDLRGTDVVEVLPGDKGLEVDFNYAYHRHMQHSKRITALCDHIQATLKEDPRFPER